MTQTPLSLLERLRDAPDQASWTRLVALYTPWLHRFLRHARVGENDVEDLRQEVLSVMVREMPQFEHNGHTGAFRSWMRNIVMNRLRGYWRARQTAERLVQGEELLKSIEDPLARLDALWDQEHDRYVAQELLKLVEPAFSRGAWQAFRRQVIDGVRAADTARELGISVNAALLAKSRVLRHLRTEARMLIDEM